MVQRLTYRKRHSYAPKSNQHRVVKTPGGPKCPVTGKRIQGIPYLRPTEYKRSRLSRNRRTVNRAYGGVLSAGAVRERVELMQLKGIGEKIADYILELRDSSPLKSLTDLEKIGLSSKQVDNMFGRTTKGLLID